MDQTSCGHAGTRRGTSDACAVCSGGYEDRADMRLSRRRVRIEMQCYLWAMHLERALRQVREAISQTLRMNLSSRQPRSCTSGRSGEAAAPSASRRISSLCFGVAHCGTRRQSAAVSTSGLGKQLDSHEGCDAELSMSWVSSAVTCTVNYWAHHKGALPRALAIFSQAFLRGFRVSSPM